MKITTWQSVNQLPEIARGEILSCWIAASFEKQDFSKPYINAEKHYLPAEDKVIQLRWLNAALTSEEVEHFNEEGDLPESSPARLGNWVNEDGGHTNYTGWICWIGGEESYYYYASPDEDGYISGGNWSGRFKILAWAPEETPEFPAGFELNTSTAEALKGSAK